MIRLGEYNLYLKKPKKKKKKLKGIKGKTREHVNEIRMRRKSFGKWGRIKSENK